VDIVFEMMKRIADERESFDKIVLVSGDGDYIKVVRYLIQKKILKRVIIIRRLRNFHPVYLKLRKIQFYMLPKKR